MEQKTILEKLNKTLDQELKKLEKLDADDENIEKQLRIVLNLADKSIAMSNSINDNERKMFETKKKLEIEASKDQHSYDNESFRLRNENLKIKYDMDISMVKESNRIEAEKAEIAKQSGFKATSIKAIKGIGEFCVNLSPVALGIMNLKDKRYTFAAQRAMFEEGLEYEKTGSIVSYSVKDAISGTFKPKK